MKGRYSLSLFRAFVPAYLAEACSNIGRGSHSNGAIMKSAETMRAWVWIMHQAYFLYLKSLREISKLLSLS